MLHHVYNSYLMHWGVTRIGSVRTKYRRVLDIVFPIISNAEYISSDSPRDLIQVQLGQI
jgi:hypothetical protein